MGAGCPRTRHYHVFGGSLLYILKEAKVDNIMHVRWNVVANAVHPS